MTDHLYAANIRIHNMEERHRAESDRLLLGAGYLMELEDGFIKAIDPAMVTIGSDGEPVHRLEEWRRYHLWAIGPLPEEMPHPRHIKISGPIDDIHVEEGE